MPAAERRVGGPLLAGSVADAGRWLAQRLRIDRLLFRHASVLLVATLGGQALGFLVQIVLARQVGIESYGIYGYAVSWMSLLSLLAVMGSDRLLVRYVSEYRAAGEAGLLRGVVAWSLGNGTAAALLIGAGFYALNRFLHPGAAAEQTAAVAWTAATLPLLVAGNLVESALRGSEAHAAATWPARVLRPLLFAALVGGLAALGLDNDAPRTLALNLAAVTLSLVPALLALRRRCPPPAPGLPMAPLPRGRWLAASAFLGLNTMALYLNSQIDMLVLGFFGDKAALGTYAAVTRLVTIVGMASGAVITIVQPMISSARAEGRDLGPLVRGGARLVLLASAGAGLVTVAFAPQLLGVFGGRFHEGATALRLLSLGLVATSAVSLAGPLLVMTGFERDATLIMAAGAVLNLALNLLLTPRLGIDGAAAATAASSLAWNLGLFLAARRRLGLAALPVRLATLARSRA